MAGNDDTTKGGSDRPTPEEERDAFTVEGHSLPQYETPASADDPDDDTTDGDDTAPGAAGADSPKGAQAELELGDETEEEKAAREKAKSEKAAWDAMPEGVRKRIARNNRKAAAAEELAQRAQDEARELRDRLEKLEGGGAGDGEELAEAPDPDDFEDMEDYEAAKAEHEAAIKAAKSAPPKKDDPKITPEVVAQAFKVEHGVDLQEFDTALGSLQEAVETVSMDLWEKASTRSELKISPPLVVSLAQTTDPAGILEHFMAHPEEAKAFSEKTPFAQARDLAKLEQRLAADTDPDDDDTPVTARLQPAHKTTAQGEPIEPVNTRGRVTQKSLEDMSQSEYEAYMNDLEQSERKGSWAL